MTNKPLPRISAALLAGAFAILPVAASVALAPSAAAVEHLDDGSELGYDPDAVAEHGIAPLSLDTEYDAADGVGDVEFRDEDGNLVDHAPAESDIDPNDLARIEPFEPEIAQISAPVQGPSTGAIVAIAAGGLAVVGGGVGLGLRARAARAKA